MAWPRDRCDRKGRGGAKKKKEICGDAFLDSGEACDNGRHNSDNAEEYVLDHSTAPALERALAPAKVAPIAADRSVVGSKVATPRRTKTAPKAHPAPTPTANPENTSLRVEAPHPPAETAKQPVTTRQGTAKSIPLPPEPEGTISKRGRRTLLNLNTKVDRVLVYAGKRRLVELSPSTTDIDISAYIGEAKNGELTFHYFCEGSKTTQTIKVSGR